MTVPQNVPRWAKWLGLFFLGASPNAVAQANRLRTAEEPRWLTLRIVDSYIAGEVEFERESRQLVGSSSETTRDRIYGAPLFGLGIEGSVYHPNLVQYHILGEGGPSWDYTDINSAGGTQDQDRYGWLGRGNASVSVLREKPYASRVFADRARIYRDYDFFNRVTVDRNTYGVQSGYNRGPVPVTVTYTHIDEVIDGFISDSKFDQDTLTTTAMNERKHGTTRLSHTIDYFRATETGGLSQDNLNNYLDFSDVEHLGEEDWITLNSHVFYNQLDNDFLPSTSLIAQEQAILKLRENLQNFYDYGLDRQTVDEVETISHQGRATLRHQLYESLTSAFDVHVETSDTEGPGASGGFFRTGVGLSETYTKRISDWGRLTLGDAVRFDVEERETFGGNFGFIVGESHTISQAHFTFLNQPRVVRASIAVRGRDVNGLFRQFSENFDYFVLQSGELTGIQRISTGGIPEGGQVLIDYQAAGEQEGTFNTLANQFFFRFDLWNNTAGIYSRVNTLNNYGGEFLMLQEYTDVVLGVDASWRWFRVGAEYEDFDSNLSPFTAVRLFQNLSFEPLDTMTLGVDFSESWTDYPDADRSLNIYQVIGRYRWAITRALSYYTEGGFRFQRGEGFDQDLVTARTALDFRYGRLTMQVGYEYQDEDFLGELRNRHFAFFRARRSF